MNINDMFAQAEAAEDDRVHADLLGPVELPSGTEVLCEITYSATKIRPAKPNFNKGPGKTFSTKLKVLEGEHAGGEFFDSLHLSGGNMQGELTPGQLNYNKRLFAKLQGAGLSASFFAGNPSDEAVAKAILGSKVRVKVQWQDPNDMGQVYLNNTTTWSPVDGASSGYTPGKAPRNPKGF